MREKLATDVRRKQIAEAALDLLATGGMRKLSVAAVARRIGLVPSAIYRHYRNKEELLQAVLDLLEASFHKIVEEASQESDSPLERLHGILLRHVRFVRQGRAFPRLVFSDEMQVGHSDRRRRLLGIFRWYLGQLEQLIEAAKRAGEASQDVPARSAAMFFLGMIIPAAIVWHVSEGGFDITQHARRVWPLFCRAIGAGNLESGAF